MRALIRRPGLTYFLIAAVFAACFCAAPDAGADSISFGLSASSLATASGGTVTFDGTVTNNSGVNLNASDFFLNFTGFDPLSVTPNQDLGVTTDFLIPKGMTSPSSVTLPPYDPSISVYKSSLGWARKDLTPPGALSKCLLTSCL